MAVTYKILGQSAPNAETTTDLYTVPSSTQALVSTLVICNQAASAASFRVATVPSGETLGTQHYTNYDVALAANDSINLTLGMSLGAGDVLKVYGSSNTISYTAFGSEITAA